jgi:hypothetical protein
MGTKACRVRTREHILAGVGDVNHPILTTPPPPLFLALPGWRSLLWRQSWHLHTLWDAPPQSTSPK